MTLPTGSKGEGGLTFLELLVVVLILAVLVGLSLPRFSRTFGHLQLEVFSHKVAKLLNYAGRRAVANGTVTRVHFDQAGRHYWLLQARAGDPESGFERVPGQFGVVQVVPETLSLEPSVPDVTFYPNGRADPFELQILDRQQDGYRVATNRWSTRVTLSEIP